MTTNNEPFANPNLTKREISVILAGLHEVARSHQAFINCGIGPTATFEASKHELAVINELIHRLSQLREIL